MANKTPRKGPGLYYTFILFDSVSYYDPETLLSIGLIDCEPTTKNTQLNHFYFHNLLLPLSYCIPTSKKIVSPTNINSFVCVKHHVDAIKFIDGNFNCLWPFVYGISNVHLDDPGEYYYVTCYTWVRQVSISDAGVCGDPLHPHNPMRSILNSYRSIPVTNRHQNSMHKIL